MKTLGLFLVACAAMAQERPLPVPESGNVTLPIEEYNRLMELVLKPAPKPPEAPLAYTIHHAEMNLQAGIDSVTGTILLDGEVYRKGAVKVGLIDQVTLRSASERGKELPLTVEGRVHTAVLTGPSDFSIALEAAQFLTIESGRASLLLPVPAAGTVRLRLEIPGNHSDVAINPGLVVARQSRNGQTLIDATLVPGQPAMITWITSDAPAPVVREARYLSEVKTLASVGDGLISLAALIDVSAMQGEPAQFAIAIPAGYEVTGAGGSTLESSNAANGVLTLSVTSGKSHQFLISLERSIDVTQAAVPFLSVNGAQRETGEVLVEGAGTMELTAKESGSLKRMDVRETNPYLQALAHSPVQAAFRYHRQPSDPPALALQWVRFPDSKVPPAVAQQGRVTTLVTSEGKSLTEIKLTLRNQSQPFLKVALPPGASILSADVGGQKVKPVTGADGSRVPLMRAGFRPTGPYSVSFVYVNAGDAFEKKGGASLSLPKMDLPIGLLEWEVFLPEQYKVANLGGDAIPAELLPLARDGVDEEVRPMGATEDDSGVAFDDHARGQLQGVVLDSSRAAIAGAKVSVQNLQGGEVASATTDASGHWAVRGPSAGRYRLAVDSPGFNRQIQDVNYDPTLGRTYTTVLTVGSTAETVEVTESAQTSMSLNAEVSKRGRAKMPPPASKDAVPGQAGPSSNVLNLQQRVAGVLPIRVEVPRAGRSFRFLRPLVVDEETRVTFTYKTK